MAAVHSAWLAMSALVSAATATVVESDAEADDTVYVAPVPLLALGEAAHSAEVV